MRTEPVRRWRGLVLTATAVVTVFTGAACGDDGDDDSTATTPTTETTEFCAAIEELGDSLAALTDVAVTREDTDELRAALDAVMDDIEAIPDAAEAGYDEVDDEVEDVRTASDALSETVAGAGDEERTSDAVATIGAAVTDLAEALGALGEALRPDCQGTG
jgi:hypothetical protein